MSKETNYTHGSCDLLPFNSLDTHSSNFFARQTSLSLSKRGRGYDVRRYMYVGEKTD